LNRIDPPAADGEVLLSPPRLEDWVRAATLNRENLGDAAFLGLPVAGMRAELGISRDAPVILSGHQPVLLHPGLYAKLLAASAVAERLGTLPLHKVTDTDVPREWNFRYPKSAGSEERNPFFEPGKQDIPYADQAKPTRSVIEGILSRCSPADGTVFSRNGADWASDLFGAAESSDSWVDFHIRTLERMDETVGARRNVRVASAIFSNPAFMRFAAAWFRSLDGLGEAYNGALDRTRREQGLRNQAEPSPNLRVEGRWKETPFWLVRPGAPRRSLWVARPGPEEALLGGPDGKEEWKASWQGGVLEVAGDVRVWPKALPQSLFARLFLGDLFIHGTGGGRYEQVNDLFFKTVFGTQPPAYGVATATGYVDPSSREEAMRHLERQGAAWQWKRRFEQNPEYAVTRTLQWEEDLPENMTKLLLILADEPGFRSLALEKSGLLAGQQDPSRRQEVGRRIRQINKELAAKLVPLAPEFESLLAGMNAIRDDLESLSCREYPFFLHARESLRKLAERISAL